ncbi:hypothetical protein OFM39_32225, partial [Escherichia coli]|nr:hypothetical protein [Escherichia coli]
MRRVPVTGEASRSENGHVPPAASTGILSAEGYPHVRPGAPPSVGNSQAIPGLIWPQAAAHGPMFANAAGEVTRAG